MFVYTTHPPDNDLRIQNVVIVAPICIFPSLMTNSLNKWIPRLFVLAIAPSVAFVIALIFYPTLDMISKCPLVSSSSSADLSRPLAIANSEYQFIINSIPFPINSSVVFVPPISENKLIFLGSVLDVRSAPQFYGIGSSYYPLASGVDASLGVLTSNLTALTDDVSGMPKGELRERAKQWLSFFFNKYQQVGVAQGRYWDADGRPTEVWIELAELMAGGLDSNDGIADMVTEPCLKPSQDEVSCGNSDFVPKITRSRGISTCVCLNENNIVKSDHFVIIHFDNCNDDGRICRVGKLEL